MKFDYDITFHKLGDIRQDLDMTQKEMAERIKVKQGVYSRWENGKELIPMRRLNEFCNITGYTMDYVVGLSKNNKRTNQIYNIDLNICGERIHKWRKESKITQKQLADFLNTTQSTISAYESGKVLILTAFAYQIAREYKVSLDFLCGRSSDMKI